MSDAVSPEDAQNATETAQEEAPIPRHPRYYWTMLGTLLLIYFGGATLLNFFQVSIPTSEDLLVGNFLLAIGLAHFVTGLRVVQADEIGGIFVLGAPTIQVSGTLVCAPAFLFTLETLTANTIEFELPEDPQHIWRGDDAPPPNSRMRPPIRITFAEGKEEGPLERRVTQEVVFFVRMRIENFFNFWKRIGNLTEARHQLEDMGVAILSADLPKVTLSKAIEDIGTYSQKLQTGLRASTRSWGVRVVDARIKQFALAHNLNQAIQDRAASVANKQTTITNAEATRQKHTLEGEGIANAVRAEIDARTGGLSNMATTLGVASEAVLASEVARNIASGPNNTVIVGTQGVTDLLGVVAAAQKAFPPKGGAPEQTGGTT